MRPIINTSLRLATVALIAGSVLAPLGCSSTETRDKNVSDSSDPVEAYNARRAAEAREHIRLAEAFEAEGRDDEAMQ